MNSLSHIIFSFLLLLSTFSFSQNLIQNPSFEDTTLAGWQNQYCGMFSYENAPLNGGNFCVKVPYGNFQGCAPNYVYQIISNIEDSVAYELTAWVKNNGWPYAYSSIMLGKKTSNGNIIMNSKNDTTGSDIWKQLSINDTFSLDVGDSALIILQSGLVSGTGSGNSYFDEITLKKTDTLLDTKKIKKNDFIKIYQSNEGLLIISEFIIKNIQAVNLLGISYDFIGVNNYSIYINKQQLQSGFYILNIKDINNNLHTKKLVFYEI